MNPAALASYRAAIRAGGGRIAETESPAYSGGELAVQAQWFGGEFGPNHVTTDGEEVFIEDFGRWNHEAGPDFIDVRVRIGDEVHRGAIELDLDVRDWERHGHATNPSFRDTVLHVFVRSGGPRFFTCTCDFRHVPQLQLSLPATPGTARPVPDPITTDAELAREILLAAVRHRLALKAAAFRRFTDAHGPEAAGFTALATALGYKHNAVPFALLAQRVTVRSATHSLLFGVAGFLEQPDPPAAEPDVRSYLRTLWEEWWTQRARCERWILPASAWRFGGARPANHPHRRVGALATMARDWPSVRDALADPDPAHLVTALSGVRHEFWDHRFTLSAERMKRPEALIGRERIRDILLNVYFPAAVSRGESVWDRYLAERGSPPPVVRAIAERFFGEIPAEVLRSAAVQQGLLQVERDHRLAADPPAYRAALRRLNRG